MLWHSCKLFYFVGNDPRIPYMCLDLKLDNEKGVKKMAGHLGRTDTLTSRFLYRLAMLANNFLIFDATTVARTNQTNLIALRYRYVVGQIDCADWLVTQKDNV